MSWIRTYIHIESVVYYSVACLVDSVNMGEEVRIDGETGT